MKKQAVKHIVHQFDTLYDGVVKQAERYGDKPRYYYLENKQEQVFTFRDMLDHVNWIASALNKLELCGKFVTVSGETHPDYVASYIGVASSGGVIIPLDKDITSDQFVGFNDMCDVECIIYTAALDKKISEVCDSLTKVKKFIRIGVDTDKIPADDRFMSFADFLEIGKQAYNEGDRTAENYVVDKEKLCAIIFTSGTTGTSKGVMLCQRNLVSATLDSCSIMGCSEKDSFVSVLPIHHTYEFTCAQLALPNTGATTAINDSIRNTLHNFAKYKPTALVLVPLYVETMHKKIWAEIEKKGKTALIKKLIPIALKLPRAVRRRIFKDIIDAFGGKLDYIVCGGAPLRPELMSDFDAFGIMICEGYGITECAPLISANPMLWRKGHSVGLRVPNMQVRIEKEKEEDETGEIVVNGPAVMLGYYKNPEATAAVFTEDGWFRTGDVGYIDEDEFIFITGRKKNIILLSNGKNVFPEELEEYINNTDIIAESVVIGRKKDENDTVITALVYPNYDMFKDCTKEEIYNAISDHITAVNKKLPTFKHISAIELRETEFEKNTSRKIMRYKIK